MSFPPIKRVPDAVVGSSPFKKNLQGAVQFSTVKRSAKETQKLMANELSGQWVGPMPPDAFLDEFLPRNDGMKPPPRARSNKYFEKLEWISDENEMYPEFMKLVKKAGVLSGIKLINTSTRPDETALDGKKIHPDVSTYDESVDTTLNSMQYESLENFLEMKPYGRPCDPFNPLPTPSKNGECKPYSLECDTQSGTYCRGQIATYATQWAARQHRTHLFMMWIADPYVRFIRMDRAGGIVTDRFNLREQGTLLLEFFWRFSHLTPEQRGRDTTVRAATEEETALAKEHLSRWKPIKERSVVVMQVPDDDTTREVIAWGAMAEPESMTGRATRGYPVWDKKLKKVIFLKDSWRSLEPGMQKESAILKLLNDKGVRHVPDFVCGDDIEGQKTRTQEYALCDWNKGAKAEDLCQRAHIRFTEDFIGLHLERFQSSKQFMQAVSDAFIAHQDAYIKCSILHRDVSGKNVMMTDEGRGILNDWDLARTLEDIKNGPRQKYRSGTWQFMSMALLRDHKKLHTLQDDLESFVYVMLYFTFRYLKHNKLNNVTGIMDTIFDQVAEEADGTLTGGDGKCSFVMFRAHVGHDFSVDSNPPLNKWIKFALNAVQQWQFYSISRQQSPGSSELEELDVSLLLRTHDALFEEFKARLAEEVWPEGDHAVDYLGAKRKLDYGYTVEPESSVSKRVRLQPRASTESEQLSTIIHPVPASRFYAPLKAKKKKKTTAFSLSGLR